MTLPTLCDPLFRQVCVLQRSGGHRGLLNPQKVRTGLKHLFDQMAEDAQGDPALGRAYNVDLQLALVFFVDFMIRRIAPEFKSSWAPLAHDKGILGGDEMFFDLLKKDLDDTSPEATQRLVVYHTCLGLGFTGCHADHPETILDFMGQIAERIVPEWMDADQVSRLCPNAYEPTDTRDLRTKTSAYWLIPAALFLAGFSFFVGSAIYRSVSRGAVEKKVTTVSASEWLDRDGHSGEAKP